MNYSPTQTKLERCEQIIQNIKQNFIVLRQDNIVLQEQTVNITKTLHHTEQKCTEAINLIQKALEFEPPPQINNRQKRKLKRKLPTLLTEEKNDIDDENYVISPQRKRVRTNQNNGERFAVIQQRFTIISLLSTLPIIPQNPQNHASINTNNENIDPSITTNNEENIDPMPYLHLNNM